MSLKRVALGRLFFVWLGLIAAACNWPLCARATELEVQISSRTVSEPMAIKSFVDGWGGHLYSGNIAWTRNRLNAGVWQGGFYLGYVQRYDYVLRFNAATAELYHRVTNGLPYAEQRWPVRLHAWHLRSQGIKLAWQWQAKNGFYLRPAVSLIKGWAFQDAHIEGELAYQGGELTGQAQLRYRYTDDLLFDHQFQVPSGQGVTTDLTVGWKEDFRGVEATFQDLYGRIWWREAPYTLGQADTFDRGAPDGVSLSPVFSGKRGLETYQQKLPVFVEAHYWQDAGHWRVHLDADYFLERLWLTPGVSLRRGWLIPYMGYEVRDGQWLLGLKDRSNHWQIRLGSDRWKLDEARSLTIDLAVHARW